MFIKYPVRFRLITFATLLLKNEDIESLYNTVKAMADSNAARTCGQTLLPLYCEINVEYSVFLTAVNYV